MAGAPSADVKLDIEQPQQGAFGFAMKPKRESHEVSFRFVKTLYVVFIAPVISLYGCLFMAIGLHYNNVTSTHCFNWEWLPSISSAIGNNAPERYWWRMGISIYSYPKLMVELVHLIVNQRRREETLEHNADAIKTNWFNLLNWITFITGQTENFALYALTVVSSNDYKAGHEWSFIVFLMFSHFHFVFFQWTYYLSRYPFNKLDARTYRLRNWIAWSEVAVLILALYIYWRHKAYCEPGMFSAFAFCEWTIVGLNVAFHSMAFFDFGSFQLTLHLRPDEKDAVKSS